MVRGDVWWADVPGAGDRPVVVLTRDPIADRISGVVTAACTSTVRGLFTEVAIGPGDGMPEYCVVSLDNLHTITRSSFRSRITTLPADRMEEICRALALATGCGFDA